MAVKYPYVSSPGPLVKAIAQFRKSLPGNVSAQTLKKLGIAPNNESYVINTLRFLGLIEDDGSSSASAKNLFSQHDDDAFATAFAPVVEAAYQSLFELHGAATWVLSKSDLITFFRNDDQSTEIVGTRQAVTFGALAGLAGKSPMPTASSAGTSAKSQQLKSGKNSSSGKKTPRHEPSSVVSVGSRSPAPIGLAVRVELVLPATTDKDVYDTIFRSIRENFVDAGQA